jgi:hypothetical protein
MQYLARDILHAAALSAACAAARASDAATINVPSQGAPTITVAINSAANGDEILVASGTYFEAINLVGKTLTIRSSGGAEATIIDGLGQLKSVVTIRNGEGPATLIEGFTIRNGMATFAAPNDRGGGVNCDGTSPTISNCIFESNVGNAGGAFYCNAGAPTIANCHFEGNSTSAAVTDGGAVYCNASTVTITDCTFEGNSAVRNAGALRTVASTMTVTRCDFVANTAGLNGGAIDMAGNAVGTYRDCRFIANGAENVGGAAQIATASSATITWINCVLQDNVAGANGGAFHVGGRTDIFNCTFEGNTASGNGGALLNFGGLTLNIRNSVVWNNAPNGIAGSSSTAYTCHQSAIAGTGNIIGDPQFANAAVGDLSLAPGSPCIDAGNTALLAATVFVDAAGLPRVANVSRAPAGSAAYGYYIDMGAFEFPAASPVPRCVGDLDGTGSVDGADLATLLGTWGPCE